MANIFFLFCAVSGIKVKVIHSISYFRATLEFHQKSFITLIITDTDSFIACLLERFMISRVDNFYYLPPAKMTHLVSALEMISAFVNFDRIDRWSTKLCFNTESMQLYERNCKIMNLNPPPPSRKIDKNKFKTGPFKTDH